MKNKGFTLVELLAVIVVLSIIALIGYSTVGNIISSTQDNSNKITMENYAKAVNQAVFLYEMNNSDSTLPELNSNWLKENVKFEKATVECEYATYDKTSSLYGCKVNNSDKTYCYAGDTAVECNKDKLSKIYGESIQNGTPTPTSPVEIQSVGEKTKNLIDEETIKRHSGYYFDGTGAASDANSKFIRLDPVTVKPNTTYKLSSNLSIYSVWFFNSNNSISIDANIHRTDNVIASFTTPANCNMLRISLNNTSGNADTSAFKWIQLEEGSTATSYEPYGYKIPITVSNGSKTKTTNIYLKEPLRKIGEYADYLDLTNKKVVRNVKEKVLNSNDKLSVTGRGISFTENVDIIKPSSTLTLPLVMCSHYNKSEWTYTMPTAGTKEGVSINSTARLIGFYDSVNTTSLEKFKTFLDSNEVKLNYLLATPTEENIDVPEMPSLTGNVTYTIDTSIKPNKLEYGY